MISVTIDASVFIASLRSSEPDYVESWVCLQAIWNRKIRHLDWLF